MDDPTCWTQTFLMFWNWRRIECKISFAVNYDILYNYNWHDVWDFSRIVLYLHRLHAFFKQYFFPTQPECCLTFSLIEMLLRCCLIHISIIIPKHFLYLLYLCLCLDVDLFMSYLCDLLFISILIFTDIILLLIIF